VVALVILGISRNDPLGVRVRAHRRGHIPALLLDAFYGVQGKFLRFFNGCLSPQQTPQGITERRKETMKSGTGLPADVETRSAPALARCCPRSFTFYLGNPFPRFPLSLFNLRIIQGLAKPISICAPGFCVLKITAFCGRTSMSLYVRSPSVVARGNSWSLRTSNSFRPPQV
jgi:hypothetical protein